MVESLCHFPVPLDIHMLGYNVVEVPAGGDIDLTGNRPQDFERVLFAGFPLHDELPGRSPL